MNGADSLRFVATAPRRWVEVSLTFGLAATVYGGWRATSSAAAAGFAGWLALWFGLAAALAGVVGLFLSRKTDQRVIFEGDSIHWCTGQGELRIAYSDIASVSYSKGRYVPTAFYLVARDGHRVPLDCSRFARRDFESMRWELAVRTGLVVARQGA